MQLLHFLLLVSSAASYKIFCLHTIPSKSHFHLVNGIVQPLLKAGHQVTFGTVYPEAVEKHDNLKLLDLSRNKIFLNYIDMADPKVTFEDVNILARNLSVSTTRMPAIREVMVKEQFEAIVTEWFFTNIDFGYAAIQRVPWIVLSGNVLHAEVEQMVDAVRSVPIIPSVHSDFHVPMTFLERLKSSFFYLMMMVDEWMTFTKTKSDYEENFGPLATARGVPLPPFEDVHKNVSILLSNSHPSFAPARSIPPNVIEIGGYHIDANIPELPKDLKDILDASTHGVIYFSMGSVLKSTALKKNTRRELLQVFGNLKQTVLWKFDEDIDNLPKNVHIRPWMPQSGILAHPNVKVFISHGGLLSTLEALYYGVPMLAIPVFADQPHNTARSVEGGYAVKVKYSQKMAPDVKAGLEEMLTNDSYFNTAKEMSKLFKNRLNKPTELITHNIELAIESKGAPHLRSVIKKYKWYEYLMMDQLLLTTVIIYLTYIAIKKLISDTMQDIMKSSKKWD